MRLKTFLIRTAGLEMAMQVEKQVKDRLPGCTKPIYVRSSLNRSELNLDIPFTSEPELGNAWIWSLLKAKSIQPS